MEKMIEKLVENHADIVPSEKRVLHNAMRICVDELYEDTVTIESCLANEPALMFTLVSRSSIWGDAHMSLDSLEGFKNHLNVHDVKEGDVYIYADEGIYNITKIAKKIARLRHAWLIGGG